MKRMLAPTSAIELIVKAGVIAALAAALLAPMTVNANGNDTLSENTRSLLKRASSHALRLPPIQHLETMPWLVEPPAQKGFKIDTLLAPNFEMMSPEVAKTDSGGRRLPPIAAASRNG